MDFIWLGFLCSESDTLLMALGTCKKENLLSSCYGLDFHKCEMGRVIHRQQDPFRSFRDKIFTVHKTGWRLFPMDIEIISIPSFTMPTNT